MIYAVIDAAAVTGRRDLHGKLARALALPAWYGNNLDALYDCLTAPGEELLLRIDRPEALERSLGPYARSFFRVLEDACAQGGRLRLVKP